MEGHKGNPTFEPLLTEFNGNHITFWSTPKRAIDHKISILPGSTPLAKAPYKLNATQLSE